MMKWAIRHVPSNSWFAGYDWTTNVDLAALYDRAADANAVLGELQAVGRANAPPYELVPMALKYAPAGPPLSYPL